MANPVTDPELLAQLNAPDPKRVEDPALLAALEAPAAPPAAAPKSTLQTIREAIQAPTRIAENGLMLGLGDRARAAIDSVLTGFSGYGENLKEQQDETARFAKDHPIAAPALEAVGGAVAPIGVVGATAKAASLGGKTLIGALTGGGIGAIQGALSSKDWTDLPQVAKDTAVGGGTGLVLGGVLPSAAKGAGALYEKAANLITGKVDGMSRGAGNILTKAVETDGPAAVQAKMAELGPDAMLVDAGPGLLGTGQGAAGNSLEARATMANALTARDKGTNARIQSDVNAALGPYQGGDPQLVHDAIIAHRKAVDSVNYPAALDNAPPMQIAPVMTDLIDRISQTPTGGMEHKALSNLQTMLTKIENRPRLDAFGRQEVNPKTGQPIFDKVPVSHDDANILHKVKGEMDNVIEYDAPGLGVPAGALQRQQDALKQMRGAINDVLEQQVPGYADANAVSAALAKRATAVKEGTQYLGNGKTTPSPERFAADFEPLSQGEKIAFAKGSRGEIERVIGTKANDLQALRGELQGEGGWNTDKIATVHGIPAANELTDSVNRNLKFRDTHNKIVENSQTDIRNAARKEMKPDPSTETPLLNPNSTFTGIGGTLAKKAVSGVVNALTRSDPTRRYGEVARALTEQGAARDARLMAVVDALQRRQGNAAASQTAGNFGGVVAALLGKSGVDELRANPRQKQMR